MATMAEAQTGSQLLTPPIPSDRLGVAVEALILTSDRGVPASRLVPSLGLEAGAAATRAVAEAVEELNRQYEQTGRAFRIEKTAGGYRAMAIAEAAPVLASLHGIASSHTLSRAAIETLSIIAYRQPITRAEIEAIRGVSSGEVIRSLLDKRLVDITGRAEELGRPMLYGTSKRFLELFGLASIKDLPKVEDFAPSFEEAPAEASEGSQPRAEYGNGESDPETPSP